MMRKALVMAVALATAAAVAPASAQSNEAQNNAEQDNLDQVICQRDTVTGSRVSTRRTCMTRREWIRSQNSVRDGLEEHIRTATGGAERGG